jgi:hypothetical protein
MNTDDLIDNLAQGLEPAPPLPAPARRAMVWSLGAGLYIVALVLGMGVVTSSAGGGGAPLWVSQAAAVVAGVLASVAAFASVVPGLAGRVRAWAVAAALVWLATLVAASPAAIDWAAVPAASHEWVCVGFIVLGGAPLVIILARMLRRGAPLRPATTAAFAALAVGTFANTGACFSLPHANGAVTLVWHGGVIGVVVALAALSGRLVFAWRSPLQQRVVPEGK